MSLRLAPCADQCYRRSLRAQKPRSRCRPGRPAGACGAVVWSGRSIVGDCGNNPGRTQSRSICTHYHGTPRAACYTTARGDLGRRAHDERDSGYRLYAFALVDHKAGGCGRTDRKLIHPLILRRAQAPRLRLCLVDRSVRSSSSQRSDSSNNAVRQVQSVWWCQLSLWWCNH